MEALAADGYENVVRLDHALQGDDLAEALGDVHMLGIRSRTQVTAEVLASANRLIAIGCFCIGTNQVDLNAALIKGVPVFNAPYSNTRSVAELVLAEAILLMRGVPNKTTLMHEGVWRKSAADSFEVRGKTLGVIGYGNIGSQLGVLAEGLGMNVVFYDVVRKLNLGNARQIDDQDELLGMADVVSMHVPATPATAGMMNEARLARMKPQAVLINASRGNVVDIPALAARIRDGGLLGAAIDVFPEEPKSNNERFVSELRGLPNVILTPHIGGSTQEAQENIGLEVAEKLIRYSDNGSTRSAVNFPEVALPEHPGQHRLLHIHENTPGILSAINQALSDADVNVAGQYLQTMGEVGYVVIDIEADYSRDVRAALAAVPRHHPHPGALLTAEPGFQPVEDLLADQVGFVHQVVARLGDLEQGRPGLLLQHVHVVPPVHRLVCMTLHHQRFERQLAARLECLEPVDHGGHPLHRQHHGRQRVAPLQRQKLRILRVIGDVSGPLPDRVLGQVVGPAGQRTSWPDGSEAPGAPPRETRDPAAWPGTPW